MNTSFTSKALAQRAAGAGVSSRASLLAVFIITFSVCGGWPAFGHDLKPIPVEKLARVAGVILEGRVASVESSWNDEQTRIYTTVTIEVSAYHKGGDPQEATFEFRMLGGTVGDTTLAILHQPRFRVDEQVFLFLNAQHVLGELPLVGGERGKFLMRVDEDTQEETISNERLCQSKAEVVELIEHINARAAGADTSAPTPASATEGQRSAVSEPPAAPSRSRGSSGAVEKGPRP